MTEIKCEFFTVFVICLFDKWAKCSEKIVFVCNFCPRKPYRVPVCILSAHFNVVGGTRRQGLSTLSYVVRLSANRVHLACLWT